MQRKTRLCVQIKVCIHILLKGNILTTKPSQKNCTRTCMIMIYLATTPVIACAGIIYECRTVADEENTYTRIRWWFTNIILLCVYIVIILRICHFFSVLTLESTNDFSYAGTILGSPQ